MSLRFSPSDAVAVSWMHFKDATGPLLGAFIITIVAVTLPMMGYFGFMFTDSYQWVGWLFYILALVIMVLVNMAFVTIGLKIADKQEWNMGDLLPEVHRILPFVGAAVLYGLITLGGLFLFILPGIFWSMRFSQWYYFVLDKKQGPVEALKSSWALTNGSFWDLIGFNAVLYCLFYLSIIPLGLGLFITWPMFFITRGYVFRSLEKHPFVPVT